MDDLIFHSSDWTTFNRHHYYNKNRQQFWLIHLFCLVKYIKETSQICFGFCRAISTYLSTIILQRCVPLYWNISMSFIFSFPAFVFPHASLWSAFSRWIIWRPAELARRYLLNPHEKTKHFYIFIFCQLHVSWYYCSGFVSFLFATGYSRGGSKSRMCKSEVLTLKSQESSKLLRWELSKSSRVPAKVK